MTNCEAFKLAAGCGWGYQAATGAKTADRDGLDGNVSFAGRYAQLNDDFETGRRRDMPSVGTRPRGNS
jgi:hypothetical protein